MNSTAPPPVALFSFRGFTDLRAGHKSARSPYATRETRALNFSVTVAYHNSYAAAISASRIPDRLEN